MSDFNIQRSPSVHQLPTTGPGTQPVRSQPQTEPNPTPPSTAPRIGQNRVNSTPHLADPTTHQLLEDLIDNAPPEQLQNRLQEMPRLQRQGAVGNLGDNPAVRDLRDQQRDQQLLTQTARPNTPVRFQAPLESNLADNFSALERQLNKATLPGTKRNVLNQVRQQAQNLIANADPQGDFLFQVSTKSEQELKLDVIKSMGLMKGKYGQAFTPVLSQHAQDLKTYEANKLQHDRLREVRNQIGPQTTPQERLQIEQQALEIMQHFNFTPQYRTTNTGGQQLDFNRIPPAPQKPVLNVDTLYNMLSSDKKHMVDAMVSGLREGLNQAPNRIETYRQADFGPNGAPMGLDPQADLRIPERFQMNGRNYDFDSHLATGGGGVVFNYRDAQSGERVVLKKDFTDLTDEAIAHRHNQGPETIDMKGILRSDSGEIFMVMERATGDLLGGLNRINQSNGTAEQKETAKLSISLDILKGMARVHQQNSSHNDMKGENVYISTDGTAKVADLGEAQTDGVHQIYGSFGTQLFNAPEVLNSETEGNRQANDVWAVGRLLYQIHTGQESPFNGQNLTFLQIQEGIKAFGQDPANRVFPNPQNKMEQLINAMMHPDPTQRPSLESVMQLSVFDGVRDGSGKAMVSQLLQ